MQLSPTARVILGILGHGPRTGYEIKKVTDVSTRFFWGASYGQIYPELRRLEAAGLVAADAPAGGRKRRVYRLTDEGEAAVRDWLRADHVYAFEVRDEGLLKLFFADLLSREDALANVTRMRAQHEQTLAHFRALAAGFERERATDRVVFPYLALDYGVAFMEWVVAWWRRLERELTRGRVPGAPPEQHEQARSR